VVTKDPRARDVQAVTRPQEALTLRERRFNDIEGSDMRTRSRKPGVMDQVAVDDAERGAVARYMHSTRVNRELGELVREAGRRADAMLRLELSLHFMR
jgi:hypothetical protein